MSKSLRFGSALSAIAIASMLGGCATPQRQTGFGGPVKSGKIGLATRALAAIQANDFKSAIPLAEAAVAGSPHDAGFRSLLGNAYFGAGRFVSAEASYRDSLAILSNQPQIILKLALVQIAQGKNDEAVSFLEAGRGVLEPADFGLALALSGRAAEAIAILEPAARTAGADARVRQNLALAHAFAGDWSAARIIAAQDLPADQLDARIQQWMSIAKPARVSDQVAALTGIAPAAVDPGQPTRLALRPVSTRMAEKAPVAEPQQVAEATPPPAPVIEQYSAPAVVEMPAIPAPEPAPVQMAAIPQPEPAPVQATAIPASAPAYEMVEAVPEQLPVGRSVKAKLPPARPVGSAPKRPPLQKAALVRHQGNSSAVIQLGAYGSRERVSLAWDLISRRFPALRGYSPMTARFDSKAGTVYRLSIKGFSNQQEAIARCKLLRSRGGSCFVRSVAGDVPVRMASR